MPNPAKAGEEVAIQVTPDDPRYGDVFITYVDFGDGTSTSCSYNSPSHSTSEDCEVHEDGRTQTCYHVYRSPGRYTIRVEGRPDLEATASGTTVVEIEVAPSRGLLPAPSPTPRTTPC